MVLSLGQVFADLYFFKSPLPLYIGFPIIAITSAIVTVIVALATTPTDTETLANFYRNVQPAGAWGEVKREVLRTHPDFRRETKFSREASNTLIALIAITALYVGTLYLVLHRHTVAGACFSTTFVLAIVLYFTWYKYLPAPQTASEMETEIALSEKAI